MKNALLLFVIPGAVLISGCATSYQSSGITGGFSDTHYAPDIFRVVFRGNGYTTDERAQDFALLRASALTLQHGFTCFAIVDENNTPSVSSYTTPGHAETTASGTSYDSGNFYFNPNGGSYSGTSSAHVTTSTTYTPPQTYEIYRPHTGLLVRAFVAKPDGIFTFDAAFLQQSLRDKYKIKPPSSTTNAPAAIPDWAKMDSTQPPATNTTGSGTKGKAILFEAYKAKAEKGDAEAEYNLGYCYELGYGVETNIVEAVKWFSKAADQGNSEWQQEVGFDYERGFGVPKDYVEAAKWYRRAAEQGNADAQTSLGFCYRDGTGVPKSSVEAYKWFNLAAAHSGKNENEKKSIAISVNARDLMVKAGDITPDQIAEAQRLSTAFVPRQETYEQNKKSSSEQTQ